MKIKENLPERNQKKPILEREINLFNSEFNDKSKAFFYFNLNILLKAGLDINSAFEVLLENKWKASELDKLRMAKEALTSGEMLCDSLNKYLPLTAFEFNSIKIAESTGRMTEVTRQLADYFSFRLQNKRLVVQVLSYPILILVTSLITVIFMLVFIVPMFAEVFKRFGSELPVLTKYVLAISNFLISNKYIFFAALILILFLLIGIYKKNRSKITGLFFKVPLIGKLLFKLQLTRLCQSLNILLKSDVKIQEALIMVENTITHHQLKESLMHVQQSIIEGQALSESMRTHKIFPHEMIALIRIYEEVNQLDYAFGVLNKNYSEEADREIKQLSVIIEPLLIIFVGLFVSIILISMYLPMFSIGSAIH